MDRTEAVRLIFSVDENERGGRAERLLELDQLLPDGEIAIHGEAAEWLFEDVKASWIYGALTATVLAANAFCIQQLSGLVRMSVAGVPSTADPGDVDLETLARHASFQSLITPEVQADLVTLHDRAGLYLETNLGAYEAKLSRHISEAQKHTDEDPLLEDARFALETVMELLHRRHG